MLGKRKMRKLFLIKFWAKTLRVQKISLVNKKLLIPFEAKINCFQEILQFDRSRKALFVTNLFFFTFYKKI